MFAQRDNLKSEALRKRAEEYFKTEVCQSVEYSNQLAKNILFFKGCSSNWESRARAYQKFLSIDALFHNLRFIPPTCSDPLANMLTNLPDIVETAYFVPLYRLIDSLLYFFEQLHICEPKEDSKKVLSTLRTRRDGFKPLKIEESADCWTIGLPLHGHPYGRTTLPISLITFDTQLPLRLSLAIEVLQARVLNESILEAFLKHGLITPGRIILLREQRGLEPDIIEVRDLLAASGLKLG
jgi:hypothetical protein